MGAIVYGAGGHGKVVLDILRQRGEEIAGFVDDGWRSLGGMVLGIPVLGGEEILDGGSRANVTHFVVAIGNNAVRAAKFASLRAAGIEPLNAVHPAAILAPDVVIGAGFQAMAGAIVNTCTVIGMNVILNTGSSVDHDCILEDDSFVGPGCHLGGTVVVGRGAFLGIGVSVAPGVSIGPEAVVGAGAVVLEDVQAGAFVAGVPARVIRPAAEAPAADGVRSARPTDSAS